MRVVVEAEQATLEEEEETLEAVAAAVDQAFNAEVAVVPALAVEVDSVDLLEAAHLEDRRVAARLHQATVLHPGNTVRGKTPWFTGGYTFLLRTQQFLNNYSKYVSREATIISHFEATVTLPNYSVSISKEIAIGATVRSTSVSIASLVRSFHLNATGDCSLVV